MVNHECVAHRGIFDAESPQLACYSGVMWWSKYPKIEGLMVYACEGVERHDHASQLQLKKSFLIS